MKMASSYSPVENASQAIIQAATQLKQSFEKEPSLVIASWTSSYSSEEIYRALLKTFSPNTKIAGATSCLGQMTQHNSAVPTGHGVALLGFHEEQGSFGVGIAQIDIEDPRSSGKEAVLAALSNAGRSGELPDLLWISQPPGSEELLMEGIQDVIGPSVPIFGGTAADNQIQGEWALLTREACGSNLITVITFFLSSPVGYAFTSGHYPTERSGTVTKVTGRVVQEIDGRPAAAVYNVWTNGVISKQLPNGGNTILTTSHFPIGRIVGRFGNVPYYQLSHPSAVVGDRALQFFTNFSEGDEIVLMHGTAERLSTRAPKVIQSAIEMANLKNERIAGALITYCASCMFAIKPNMPTAISHIKNALPDIPFFGVYTFGEQGCFRIGENRHANLMISAVIFGS